MPVAPKYHVSLGFAVRLGQMPQRNPPDLFDAVSANEAPNLTRACTDIGCYWLQHASVYVTCRPMHRATVFSVTARAATAS